MFRRHLHPSPFGLALGIVLVALWAGVWVTLLSSFVPQTQTRRLGQLPEAARMANLYELTAGGARPPAPS